MKKWIALLIISLALSHTALSNDSFFPGYYLNLQGDTIRCKVDFNDWNLNPKTIKVQVNNNEKTYGPTEIKGFGVYGYNDYISANVNYHISPVDGNAVPIEFSDSTVNRNCFLKILEQGPYNLYNLVYPDRVYFFIGIRDSTISELLFRAKEVSDTVVYDRNYRNIIFGLFVKEGTANKYFNRINSANYNASDIGSLFSTLNAGKSTVQYKKKNSGSFQADIIVGALRTSFPTTFNTNFVKSGGFDPSTCFSGGLNFMYSIPGKFKAFKIGLSLTYNSYNTKLIQSGTNHDSASIAFHSVTNYHDTLALKNKWLQGNLYILYLINPRSRLQVYIKGGLSYNTSLTSPIWATSDYSGDTQGIRNGTVPFGGPFAGSNVLFSLKENYLSFMAGAGCVYGRHKLEFAYWTQSSIQSLPIDSFQSDDWSTFKIGGVGIYYYFSIFPLKRG